MSELRTELVLTHLAAELDAEYLGSSVAMQASLASVLPVDAVKEIVDDLQDKLMEMSRLREICAPKVVRSDAPGALSLDAMAKLYEAMKSSGFLNKKSTAK